MESGDRAPAGQRRLVVAWGGRRVVLMWPRQLLNACQSLRNGGGPSPCGVARKRERLAKADLADSRFHPHTWSEFLFALILTGYNTPMLTVVTARFVYEMGIQWNLMAATAIMAMVPPVLAVLFAQRFILAGFRVQRGWPTAQGGNDDCDAFADTGGPPDHRLHPVSPGAGWGPVPGRPGGRCH